MSVAPTVVEVERAKSQLKASMLLTLDGTTAVAEDIGRQIVTSGRRFTPKQIENAIDAVTTAEIQRVAQKYLWDKDVSIRFVDFAFSAVLIFGFRSRSRQWEASGGCSTITGFARTCRRSPIR